MMELWWAYLLLGLITGIFGAMLGVGGGIVMVPILVMFFSISQKSAQGMSLAVMILMAVAATLRYMTNPEVRIQWFPVGLISLTAIIGAIIGSELVKHIPVRVLQKIFAVVMVIAAVKLAFFTKPKVPAKNVVSKQSQAEASPTEVQNKPPLEDDAPQ
jgi:hypothetical protein